MNDRKLPEQRQRSQHVRDLVKQQAVVASIDQQHGDARAGAGSVTEMLVIYTKL